MAQEDAQKLFEEGQDADTLFAAGEEVEPLVSKLESGIRGAAQGLSMGFADELAGAARSAYEVATTDKNLSEIKNLYGKYRDLERAKYKEAEQANPKTYMASEIGAGILGPNPFAKLGAIKGGITAGATYALGSSEGQTAKQQAKDVAQGAGFGGVGGAVGEGISHVIGKTIPEALSKGKISAGDTALNILKVPKPMLEKELGAGGGLILEGDFRKGIGQAALDKLKIGGVSRAVEDTNQELSSLIKEKNSLFNKLQGKNIEESLKSTNSPAFPELSQQLQTKIENTINKISQGELDQRSVQNVADMASDYLAKYNEAGNDIFKLNDLRKELGQRIRDKVFMTDNPELAHKNEVTKGIYFGIRDRLNQMLETLDPEIAARVREINKKESNLLDLKTVLDNAQTKEITGGLAPTDMGLGFAGAGLGAGLMPGLGVMAPIAGITAVNLGRAGIQQATGYAPGNLSKLAYAKAMNKAPQIAPRVSTVGKAVGEGIQRVAPKLPEILTDYSKRRGMLTPTDRDMTETPIPTSGSAYNKTDTDLQVDAMTLLQNPKTEKLGKQLQEAIQGKDQTKKNKILFLLMQNPDARALMGSQNP